MEFKTRKNPSVLTAGLGLAIWLSLHSATVRSDIVSLPYTFVAGTPASASEVNANFQALATAINNLQQDIGNSNCSTITTDLDFKLISFGVGLGGGSNYLHSQAGIIESDACLKSNGNLIFEGNRDVYTETNGPQSGPNATVQHSVTEQGNDPEGELSLESFPYTLNSDCSIVIAGAVIDSDIDLTLYMNRALTMGVGTITEKFELCNDGSDCTPNSTPDNGDAYYHELVVLVRKGDGATFCANH